MQSGDSMRSAIFSAGLALLVSGGAAAAAEPWGELSPAYQPASFPYEVRLGVFAHDPGSTESQTPDINAEALFAPFGQDRSSPWGWLTPRVHVGVTGHFGRGTSIAYAGFTWTYDITRAVFVEGAFGGAVNNGRIGNTPADGWNHMGCRLSFHESATLGYRITPVWSVMATVEHASNAGLCDENRGLTNFGLRVGYSF